MTYGPFVPAVPYPAFRDVAEARAWAVHVCDAFNDLAKRFNAVLAETRKVQADAIDDLDLDTLTDPTAFTAFTDPGDTPASADALRDDLVANTIPDIEGQLATFRTQTLGFLNEIEARHTSIQTAVNAILAALRSNQTVEE